MLLYGRLIVQHLTQRILGEKTICELLDIFTEPLSIYLCYKMLSLDIDIGSRWFQLY